MSGASSNEASEFGKDMGLLHEAVITGRKAGMTREDWGKLAHDEDLLRQIIPFLRGHAKIEMVTHLIDCDADPFLPEGWKGVEEHKKGGSLAFDASKVGLYLSKQQTEGQKWIVGNNLRKELEDKPVLNANVLDYLLAHPEIIPDAWKGKYLYFWGTIYRLSDGSLYVRCLYWNDGRWDWDDYWLGRRFSGQLPALVLASVP